LINFDEISFSFFKKIFIRIKNQIKSKSSTFTKSILFYPIVFSLIAFLGFLLTSRIDESFSNEFNIETPILNSLIFAGSADSARSILSAIAGGWTTILGVAFSITLVTLQLSTSRYTSYLVNKFEEDRINKLTLGWFIAVVLYSLLVLKSVRTEEGGAEVFIPIVGVNVSISIALIGLFIFALFLSNISSYLKPKILVSKLISQIIYSIHSQGKRNVDSELLQEIYEQELPTERRKKILEIKAKENGILRYIDWNSISCSLHEIFKNSRKRDISISLEFLKSIGDWIETGNSLVIVSEINNADENKEEQEIEFSFIDKNNSRDSTIQKENNKIESKKNVISDFQNQILSSIDINKDRDISKDPMLGIELLRNLAIKSAKKNDIDIVNSCITGLFRIVIYLLKGKDIFGLPFRIKINSKNEDKKFDKKKKLKIKKNNIPDDDNKTALSLSSSKNNEDTNTIIITIKPKEKRLTNVILSDLAIINNMGNTAENIPIIKHILLEFISFSKELLENENDDKFYLITNWYSKLLLSTSYKSLSKQFYHEIFIVPLLDFQNYLLYNYPHIKNGFDIYMKDILGK
jgi:uncharacterized membrane protein